MGAMSLASATYRLGRCHRASPAEALRWAVWRLLGVWGRT